MNDHQKAFPRLDASQMASVAQVADKIAYPSGETLIKAGLRDYPFFVIADGEVEIIEQDEGVETPIATHGPGEFVGDVDMLTGRSAIFTARATSEGIGYKLTGAQLRKLLARCPIVSDLLLEAFQSRRKLLKDHAFRGVRVIGRSNTRESMMLREFLHKNHVPYTYFEADSGNGRSELERLDASGRELPVVRCNGVTFSNPELLDLARCIGIVRDVDQRQFDLVIVGSGPAGLAAAVYAASEGIEVLVIDSVGPGGQAGSSSKIENFIGFPSGLSGNELANRGYLQALKFGAQFIAPITVLGVDANHKTFMHSLHLSNGQCIFAKCVLVTTGVSYRQLDLPGCREFEGAGVYYAATTVEARVCEGQTAIVVGGGNSAGQAAMYLASYARSVKLLIRGDDLTKGMSSYLSGRVAEHPNIEVMKNTEVESINGDSCVQSVTVRNNQTGDVIELPCAGLFIFIGAKPHTDWLPKEVLLDEKGFVLTGASFFGQQDLRQQWPIDRSPCDLETSVPGILAGGDVRSGTTKRCGFAVGDGSLAVTCVHRFLASLQS